MKGYKGFESDFSCRGFQYEVGHEYIFEESEPIELCKQGFHFCKSLLDVFHYYTLDAWRGCRYAEVEAFGDVIVGDDKCVTNKIRIIREIPRSEVIPLSMEALDYEVAETCRNNGKVYGELSEFYLSLPQWVQVYRNKIIANKEETDEH